MKAVAIAFAALLALSAAGQTNLPPAALPAMPAASVAPFSANWCAIPFATYSIGSQQHYGGGLAVVDEVTPSVAVGLRLDYLDGAVWMPSMSLQLQTHVPVGPFTVIPFAFSGAATPLTGTVTGGAVGIVGAGVAVRIGGTFDLVGDLEHWTAVGGTQARFGIVWRF